MTCQMRIVGGLMSGVFMLWYKQENISQISHKKLKQRIEIADSILLKTVFFFQNKTWGERIKANL